MPVSRLGEIYDLLSPLHCRALLGGACDLNCPFRGELKFRLTRCGRLAEPASADSKTMPRTQSMLDINQESLDGMLGMRAVIYTVMTENTQQFPVRRGLHKLLLP